MSNERAVTVSRGQVEMRRGTRKIKTVRYLWKTK